MTTETEIKERINERLTISANTLEGGFSQDIIGSVAYELANIKDVDEADILKNAFVTTAEGEYLDKVAQDYGFYRKEATYSKVILEIQGQNGATVNTNLQVAYNNLTFQVTEYKVIGSSGVVTVKAECTTKGTVGNVAASTLTNFVGTPYGLTSVTNNAPAYDGVDTEDDETFRARILKYLAEDGINCNKAQYEQWALSVSGVDKAIVKSAETVGAGNVGVYIASYTGTISNDLINTVKSYIEERQFINANLTVQSMTYKTMSVSATLTLASGYTAQSVKAEFEEVFKAYLKTVTTVVSYFKISDLLLGCSGVRDITNYTLNGTSASVTLSDTDFATMGVISING